MKLKKNVALTFALLLLIFAGMSSFNLIKKKFQRKTNLSLSNKLLSHTDAIIRSKIKRLEIKCLSFSGKETSFPLHVIDVMENDVIQIFQELKEMQFPIYALSCYAPRTTINGKKISLHAYASAIDMNYLVNPYYDAIEKKMIPTRKKDPNQDIETIKQELRSIKIEEDEIDAVLKTVIQPHDSDDRFSNREILRKGMVTPKIVKIFKEHGFNIWGGNWRRPIDYMHFQIPRSVAEQLATNDLESRRKIWETHKEKCQSDQDSSS